MSIQTIHYPSGDTDETTSLSHEEFMNILYDDLSSLFGDKSREADTIQVDCVAYLDEGHIINLRARLVKTDFGDEGKLDDPTVCLSRMHTDRLLDLVEYITNLFESEKVHLFQYQDILAFILNTLDEREDLTNRAIEVFQSAKDKTEYQNTVIELRFVMSPESINIKASFGFECTVDDDKSRAKEAAELGISYVELGRPRTQMVMVKTLAIESFRKS